MSHKDLIGFDLHEPTNILTHNNTGSTIAILKVVKFQGGLSGTNSYKSITPITGIDDIIAGVVSAKIVKTNCIDPTSNIANNDDALITAFGTVYGINTSSLSVGTVYVNALGDLTSISTPRPVGTIIVSDANDGIIFFDVKGVKGDVGTSISTVSVSSIDDPSPELNLIDGTTEGELFLVKDSNGISTFYVWSSNLSESSSTPYVVDGASVPNSKFQAIGGRYTDMIIESRKAENVVRAFYDTPLDLTSSVLASANNGYVAHTHKRDSDNSIDPRLWISHENEYFQIKTHLHLENISSMSDAIFDTKDNWIRSETITADKILVLNEPRVGEEYYFKIKSDSNSILSFPTGSKVMGEYDNSGIENYVTVFVASDSPEYWIYIFQQGKFAGNVDDVFGRVGTIVASSGDYNSNQIDNLSVVSGLSVTQALDTLNTNIQSLTQATSGGSPISTQNAITGLVLGGLLSITFGDNTRFDISETTCQFVDNFTDPLNPVLITKTFSIKTSNIVTNLATDARTNVALDVDGNIIQKTTPFTESETRDYVVLGKLIHRSNVDISSTLASPQVAFNQDHDTLDFMRAFGSMNIDGNVYNPNGINLRLNKTVGKTFRIGTNWENSRKRASVTDDSVLIALSKAYRYRDGSGDFLQSVFTDTLEPNFWDDDSGILQNVPTGYYTIQPIFFFGATDSTFLQYGQTLYPTQEEAEVSVNLPTEIDPNLSEATVRGWLIVKQGSTDASDESQIKFIDSTIFKQGPIIGSSVKSVFLRVGSIVASSGDYNSDQIDNTSTVSGSSVSDSLEYLSVTLSVTGNEIQKHIDRIDNPHDVQKSQVGLGNVDNFTTATSAQAISGSSDENFMTPQGTKLFFENLKAITTEVFDFVADMVDTPIASSYNVPIPAPLVQDSLNNSIIVRTFDDTIEEAIAFEFLMPNNVNTLETSFVHRSETAPTSSASVSAKLHYREIPNNTPIGNWNTFNLDLISMPTTDRWQNLTQFYDLTSIGLDEGQLYQFQLSRTGGTLLGDWVIHKLKFTANIGLPIKYQSKFFMSDNFLDTIQSDWAISEFSPLVIDSNDNALKVRGFDDTTEQGVGFHLDPPSNKLKLTIISRADLAPITSKEVILVIHYREIPDGTAIGAWQSTPLSMITTNTNTNFSYDTILVSLGLSIDKTYQIQISRDVNDVNDNLVGNWNLLSIRIEYV